MKVAFYGRVSTDEQAERGNIETQISFWKKYVDLYSEAEGIEEYKIYIDDGVSGTVPIEERPGGENQPGGAGLIKDIDSGEVDAVYVYRIDRLARKTILFLNTLEFFESKNIKFKSMTESFDTSTPSGKLFVTLLASIAAWERDTILERTQLGKEQKAKEGRWTSGPPPFGYNLDPDKKPVINDYEAETVRIIFQLYCDGMSQIDVAKYLNAQNKRTPTMSKKAKNKSTGKWHAGHISIILRNRVYIGEYQTMQRSKKNKEGRIIKFPPIVTNEQFEKANGLIVDNSDVARGKRGKNYLLRGLIKCGNCGRSFVGSSGGSNRERVYYRCSGTQNQGQGKRCDAKLVPAKVIEEAVIKDIEKFLKNPGKVVDALEKTIKHETKDLEPIKNEINGIDKAILEKIAARKRLISLISKGAISETEAEDELITIAGQIDILNGRKDSLLAHLNQTKELSNQAVNVAKMLEEIAHDANPGNYAELIKGLVNKIVIYTKEKGGKRISVVDIDYIFKDDNGQLIGSQKKRKQLE